jgi:hypothetical protein
MISIDMLIEQRDLGSITFVMRPRNQAPALEGSIKSTSKPGWCPHGPIFADLQVLAICNHNPGDIFPNARFRITMAARAAGRDAVDDPYADFRNEARFRSEALRAMAWDGW